MAIFDRGDVERVNVNPIVGHEIIVDLHGRSGRKIELAPKAVIDDAIFRFLTVFESFHRI